MAGRSRTTFNKLQKERARREKQIEKQARKQQRKLDKQTPGLNEETTGLNEEAVENQTSEHLPMDGGPDSSQ